LAITGSGNRASQSPDGRLLVNSFLDRIAHNAYQIFLDGDSYRKRMGRTKRQLKTIEHAGMVMIDN
jgi:hypothetical protein